MPIRKIAEIKLKAGPYGRLEAVGSGFKFYSYDKDSAAIDFYFREQNGSPTDILGCTTELVLLTKEDGQQKKLTIIDSEVEIISALKGHARYVIPDRLRGYVGLVQGYVYLNFPDESRTDECRFDFTIERSLIEEEFENGGDYYINDIQFIFDEVKDTLNSKIPEMQTKYDDLVKTFTDYANEKIAEYDSRFVTLNSNLLTLQDSLTTAQNKVTTLEQSIATANTNLNTRINEINKKIDDNDVFTKQESSANVVYQIIGREKVRMNITLDFKDKIRGSIEKNLNFLSHTANLDLSKKPDNYTYESEQHRYDKISILDGASSKISTVEANNIPGYVATYPILDVLKRVLGEQFFLDRKASDLESEVQVVRNLVKKISYTVNGFGVSDGKGKLTCQLFTETDGGRWLYSKTTNALSTTEIRNDVSGENIRHWIDANGKSYLRVYANVSSETAVSTVSLDYLKLDFEIEISVNDHIKSLIAANHVQNLATQDEAEAGTDNTKTMTPLRTAQQIEKKAVTIAGNQTVGGIKNFKDGVLLDDVPVFGITRNVVFDDAEVGGYFNAVDKISLGAVGKIDKVVLVWSRVDDSAGTLLNYSWSQTVLFPDDIILGNSYRVQLTSENYKFITFKNESGILTISGSNENSVAPNRIYRIKRIVAYIKK